MSKQPIVTGSDENVVSSSQTFELEYYFTSGSNGDRCVIIPMSSEETNLATQWIAAGSCSYVSVEEMR